MIRLAIPSLEKNEIDAVCSILSSGYLVQGCHVAAFEAAVADHVGTEHAIAVSSCTAALHLALLSLGVKPEDMVLVTAYSFIATANAVELCGARPIFIDICQDTFNIDPEKLEQTLKSMFSNKASFKRIKAILPVHTFGKMADMPSIMTLAEQYEIPVIEDAACALGASIQNRKAGSWGRAGCFSFHPRKAITTGEGGAITTNDSSIAERCRILRNHGQAPNASSVLDAVVPGYNYRLTEFQAALGRLQLERLEQIINRRRQLAKIYDQLLLGTPILHQVVSEEYEDVWQSYVVKLPDNAAPQRAELIASLKEMGIETTIGTWHLPLATYYRTRYGYARGDFPVTDEIFARSLTLPLSTSLSEKEQKYIVECLLEATAKF